MEHFYRAPIFCKISKIKMINLLPMGALICVKYESAICAKMSPKIRLEYFWVPRGQNLYQIATMEYHEPIHNTIKSQFQQHSMTPLMSQERHVLFVALKDNFL
jgi:hypothetical protein